MGKSIKNSVNYAISSNVDTSYILFVHTCTLY